MPPLTERISSLLEKYVLDFYSTCSLHIPRLDIAFLLQWVIMILQIVRFLSDAYVPYNWDNRAARVLFSMADFVTEIPWVSPMTAYFMTLSFCFYMLVLSVGSMLLHKYFSWTRPLTLLQLHLSTLHVLYMPRILPHLKMILPCLSYSLDSHVSNPFYPDLACWSNSYNAYFVVSVTTGVLVFLQSYLSSTCLYLAEIPHDLQRRNHPLHSKHSSSADSRMILVVSVLLILNVAGHNSTWRLAMGALAFLFGVALVLHLAMTMNFWHDTAMALYLFLALTLAWTGVIAMVSVAFDSARGTDVLYFVILPVLFLGAHMLLRWRTATAAAMRESELTSPALAVVKIRCMLSQYFRWIAQFGDVYIVADAELETQREHCYEQIERVIEVATRRFPDSAELFVLSAQFYLFLRRQRTNAYRYLSLAERAGGNLGHRVQCHLLRSQLRAAMVMEESKTIRAYNEFKAKKQVCC